MSADGARGYSGYHRRNRVERPNATRHALRVIQDEPANDDDLPSRPRTRGECIDGPRPCPWAGCRHHLFLDVTPAGNLLMNFPGTEPDEMTDSCSLDVADQGGQTLEDVGRRVQLTRERVRQLEVLGVRKAGRAAERMGVEDVVEHQGTPLAEAIGEHWLA